MSEGLMADMLLHGVISIQKPHSTTMDRGYYLVHAGYLDYNELRNKKYVSFKYNGSIYYAKIEIASYISGLFKINFRVVHQGSKLDVIIDDPLWLHRQGVTSENPILKNEAVEMAWKLLEEYMKPNQYFAFMEGTQIELENTTSDFRLIIDKGGAFTILEGKRGAGIVASSGRIRSYNYPLGDEIAAFLDWFNHKTKELIAQWNCGTYGIVKEGQRR